MTNIDTDHDGTIDLAEANPAAAGVFDRLERDNEATLDARELKGRLSAKELAVADRTMTAPWRRRYLAIVERRFKAANADADDTIDAREFDSKAGRALPQLVKSSDQRRTVPGRREQRVVTGHRPEHAAVGSTDC